MPVPAVEGREHEAEVRLRRPAGKDEAEGRQQQAGGREPLCAPHFLEAGPACGIQHRRATMEAGGAEALRRPCQWQLGTCGQEGQALQPVLPVRLPGERVLFRLGRQDAISEGKGQRAFFHSRVGIPGGEILHQDAETVGIGHQQIQFDVQAYGSGIQAACRDLQQRGLVRGQYLVGKLFPFLPENAFLLLFGQGGKVFERDAAGRDRRQDALPSVRRDDAAQHVMPPDEGIHGFFQPGDVQSREVRFHIIAATDATQRHAAVPSDPVGVLHVRQGEGQVPVFGTGNDVRHLLRGGSALFLQAQTFPQGGQGGSFYEQGRRQRHAEASAQALCQLHEQQGIETGPDQGRLRGQGDVFGQAQDGAGLVGKQRQELRIVKTVRTCRLLHDA